MTVRRVLPILFLCFLRAGAQPAEYAPRGSAPYLVNYGAIGGDRFLATLAARRFVLIDEGSRSDITLLHATNPALPVLLYRDMVALHASFPEYDSVSRDEHAFLHCGDPAGLTLFLRGDTASIVWVHDRRPLPIQGYRVLFSLDSLGTFRPLVDSLVKGTTLRVRLPKSATWVRVDTEAGDGTVPYGRPVAVRSPRRDEAAVALAAVDFTRGSGAPREARVAVTAIAIGDVTPDSVLLFCDINRDNTIDERRERFRMADSGGSYRAVLTVSEGDRNLGGYECLIRAHHRAGSTRYPATGSFNTNVNNRLMNDYYGFFVMDVGRSTWLRASVSSILRSFARDGYNGLFEDDTWYRVERWGCDAYPPAAYNDAAWGANMYTFLDSIKAAVAPRPAYFNGLYAARSDSLLLHADGGMTEGFAYTHWSAYVTGAYWKELCDVGLRCQHQFRRTWLALGGAPHDDPAARLYTLASYLLVADSLSLYANATDYQEFSHFPEFDIPLGRPRSNAAAHVDELQRPGSASDAALFVREFEHATVIVNADPAKSGVFPGASSRRMVTVSPGTTVAGGVLGTGPARDTIPAKSACILLADPAARLASPRIDSIVFDPPQVPADGSTPVTVRVLARDSSTTVFRSGAGLPLYVTASLGALGGPRELRLRNDGSPAGPEPSWYEGTATIPMGAPPHGTDVPVTAYASTGLFAVAHAPLDVVTADSTNLVLNFSFEIDDNDDGVPDVWRSYVKGFVYDTTGAHARTGRRSVSVRNDSLTESRGVYCSIDVNQAVPADLELSGWSKAEDVSGAKDNDYALYVDVQYTDGTPLYGQCAQFSPGSHDWEYATKVIRPAKPIRRVSLYALFRRHTGRVWFDQIALRPYEQPNSASETPVFRRDIDISAPWPQPSRGTATFRVALRQPASIDILLTDALGRVVVSDAGRALGAGVHTIPIDLRYLPAGVYRYHIRGSGGLVHTGVCLKM